MGGDLIKAIIEKMPSWVFSIIGIGIIALFGYICFLVSRAGKKFMDVVGEDSKIKDVQEELHKIKLELTTTKGIASQFSTVVENLSAHMYSFENIRNTSSNSQELIYGLANLLSKMTETLASDVKFSPGEKHRCGFWVADNQSRILTLTHASAGFPSYYISNRELEFDKSIAGKALRLKQTINEEDVSRSLEWSKNPESLSRYTSIISTPVGDLGVITIDSMSPMIPETITIVESYAPLFKLVFMEIMVSLGEETVKSEPENVLADTVS